MIEPRLDLGRYRGDERGVYLAQALGGGDFIKIGYAAWGVESRIRGWVAGCPFPVRLLRVFSGTKEIEQQCHNAFRDFMVCGEWFLPAEPLLKFSHYSIREFADWCRQSGRHILLKEIGCPAKFRFLESGTLAGLVP